MRAKLHLGLLITILFVTFGAIVNHYIVDGTLKGQALSELDESLKDGYRAYVHGRKAGELLRQEQVMALSNEPVVAAAVQKYLDAQKAALTATEEERKIKEEAAQTARFDLFEALATKSGRREYRADMYIFADREGNEVVRTITAKMKTNKYGQRALIQEVFNDRFSEDVWLINKVPAFVTAGPVRINGQTVGALLRVEHFDEELVNKEKLLVSGQFAFFDRNSIFASTLQSNQHKALDRFFQNNRQTIAKILLKKDDFVIEHLDLAGQMWAVIFSPLQGLEDKNEGGFMILRNLSNVAQPFDDTMKRIWVFVLLLTLITVAGASILVEPLYGAVNFVLEGAHKIIIGDKDYQFSSDNDYYNAIGQTLNLMIAILLGKYIPEDEDELEGVSAISKNKTGNFPTPGAMMIETMTETSKPDQTVDASTADEEDEETYYARLFKEFVQAKVAVGDDVSMVTKDKMVAKLRKTEAKLIEKHGCKKVRFSVRTEVSKVTLKPTPIWNGNGAPPEQAEG